VNTNFRKLLSIFEIIKEIEDGDVDGEGIEDKLLEEGDRQQESGEYENSIICYDKAIEVDPKWVSPWLNKGMTYWKSEKYEEAITCYDKANELLKSGSNTTGFFETATDEIWRSKGGIYAHWGKYEEAITCYDKQIEFHPNPFSWNRKGNALDKLGRHEEAKECFSKASEFSGS
jgi:tetratricopeptide (TPR) repeat protein